MILSKWVIYISVKDVKWEGFSSIPRKYELNETNLHQTIIFWVNAQMHLFDTQWAEGMSEEWMRSLNLADRRQKILGVLFPELILFMLPLFLCLFCLASCPSPTNSFWVEMGVTVLHRIPIMGITPLQKLSPCHLILHRSVTEWEPSSGHCSFPLLLCFIEHCGLQCFWSALCTFKGSIYAFTQWLYTWC